jgi:hypothetical protein
MSGYRRRAWLRLGKATKVGEQLTRAGYRPGPNRHNMRRSVQLGPCRASLRPGASCGWRGYQPSLVSPKRPPQLVASFVCRDARCQLTDILGAATSSADQATDGGLPDPAQPLATSSCRRQRPQRHELALGQGNRVVERSFPAYAILKSRVT